MAKPSKKTPEQKLQIVFLVLRGELSAMEASRRVGVSEQWGHRKIWAIARADGCPIGSQSSVKRAMARRDLLQPAAYRAERRQLARERRETFLELRYERLYRHDIADGVVLAEHVDEFNRFRPHQAIPGQRHRRVRSRLSSPRETNQPLGITWPEPPPNQGVSLAAPRRQGRRGTA